MYHQHTMMLLVEVTVADTCAPESDSRAPDSTTHVRTRISNVNQPGSTDFTIPIHIFLLFQGFFLSRESEHYMLK
jgi:hypothetical protein